MPCGLYIHTPFCETKCGYCDFYSVALKGRRTAPLVDALLRELEVRLAAPHPAITTVFVGGGTPTLLDFEDLARLLQRITIAVPAPVEFTVEANPATVDEAKAALLAESGVTRVSMGAQSFFPAELTTLERLHTPDDIGPSVEVLRRAGIGQINLDLIFGIPGQTLRTWSQSLRRALDLEPDHIACYGLTYEPATRLTAQQHAGRITPCDEDLEAEMYLQMVDTLGSAGFRQYEISNFARRGCECRHNLIYWRNEPYIGVGPSAAGCYFGSEVSGIVRPDPEMAETVDVHAVGSPKRQPLPGGRGSERRNTSVMFRRYKNVPDIGQYGRMIRQAGCAEIESELIGGETLAHEIILMQLRLDEGISRQAFRERCGTDPVQALSEALPRLVSQGLLQISDESIALTRAGRLVANRVMADLAAVVAC